MENRKLMSMVDYILDQYENNYHANTPTRILNYANFLKKPLKLGMFIPCNENNEVLETPKIHYSKSNLQNLIGIELSIALEINEKAKKYQEAKDNVLFIGFELEKYNDEDYEDISASLKFKDTYVGICYKNENKLKLNLVCSKETIEDLVERDLTLTKSSIIKNQI